MMKKSMLTSLVLSLIMVFSIILAPSGASVYGAQAYSLTVKFITDEGPIAGSDFKVYRAYDSSYHPVGKFADYPADLGDMGGEAMSNLALTLSSYAADNDIAPDQTETSDESGEAYFGNLTSGLYLVTGTAVQKNDVIYTPKPFMVSVPYRSQEGTWVNDVVAEVKYDRREVEKKTVDISVEKTWMDGDGVQRPDQVKVRLLKDGELYEEVTLDQENQWKHTWEKMEDNAQYQLVEEDVPDGYNVSVTREDNSFVVTNRYETVTPTPGPGVTDPPVSPAPSDAPGTQNPPASNPPGSNPPAASSSPVISGGPSATNPPSAAPSGTQSPAQTGAPSERLPQTGQLWWPVPIFLAVGILLVIAGKAGTRSRDHEQ